MKLRFLADGEPALNLHENSVARRQRWRDEVRAHAAQSLRGRLFPPAAFLGRKKVV